MAEKLPAPTVDSKAGKETKDDSQEQLAKPAADKSTSAAMQSLYFGETEESYQVSSYYPDSFKKPYNPDPLVMKDYTYKVYEDMLIDDQIDIALKIKKDLVIGSGWYLECGDDFDQENKKEIENSLSDETDRPFSEILQDILQAYEYGFSISEKIFKKTQDGRLALKDIKPRHPASWLLHTDDHGNMTTYEQRAITNSIKVNPDSLIHYINNHKFQNPYGKSDLYPAYQAYMTKRHITRFYAIYLENAAGPKAIAKYDRRAPQNVVTEVFNIIKNFQTKTAMTVPKEFEIEFLEAKTNGEAYIKGIDLFNMFIGRALFVPDLLGFQGAKSDSGSMALGQEQIEVLYKHVYRRRHILERIMDQHVIRPLIVYNYGLQKDYPKFKFNPLSETDAMKQAELWIKGVQGAGWKPSVEEVNHFRHLVKFPESEDVELKADAAPQVLGPDGKPLEKNGAPNKDGLNKNPDDKAKSKDDKPDPNAKDDAKQKQFKLALSTMPGEYKKKVDFKLADNLLKTNVGKILKECEPIVSDMFENLYDQLEKKKIVQKQDLELADSIGLKFLKPLQIVFKKHFRSLYKDAQIMAKSEIKKSDNATNIPADEFLAFLEDETYKYIGDYSYTITKKTKDLLIQAIKDGTPVSDVISVLDDEGKKLSDVSLERFARTKSTEVFNRGRMEYFESTGVVAAYQYSAILDDVTSETCSELNGLIFDVGDEPVPPLHFNCRSVLVPITKYEKYESDDVTNSGKNIDKFLDENVTGKGFPIN